MKNDILKLIVRDAGDPSVGIFPTIWEVDAPFSREHDEPKDLNDFRNEVIKLYKEFAEGKLTVLYDFEIEQIEKSFES